MHTSPAKAAYNFIQKTEVDMQYKEWLEEWLELYVRASTKQGTFEKYRQQAEKYLLPMLGEYDLDALGAVELQKFSVAMSDRGLAANTVNGVINILQASLKKAAAVGLVKQSFSGVILRPRTRESKVTCFGKQEQRRIEQYILEQHSPHLFGIVLCLYSGLRIGELLALTWGDIDFMRGTLTVSGTCRDSWKNGHYEKVFDTAKTQSSERVIPLPKQIVAHLREMKRKTRDKFVVPGKTPYGTEVRTYQRTFTNLLGKLGIPHHGFHALRHTFATRALEVGMDVKTLAEILGHKDPMITLRRYAHSLLEHKSEMMNKVGKLLA